MSGGRLWNLIAELTYRCPLRCPYCSNPKDWAEIRDGLDAGEQVVVAGKAALREGTVVQVIGAPATPAAAATAAK